MKTLWITALDKDKELIAVLTATAQKYGLSADGHFWQDDLKKMAWMAVVDKLMIKDNSLWVIVGNEKALTPEIRYGLTLLTLTIRQQRPTLPILWLDPDGKMEQKDLPGVFAATPLLSIASPTLAAKFAAMANMPAKQQRNDYKLKVHANPGYGIWFETGPTGDNTWKGVMLGTSGGDIKSQGVGEDSKIPDKCVLEYPVQGMELEVGEKKITAWGVQNTLTSKESYFVKVDGVVEAFLFGEFPASDDAEMHSLKV